MNKYNAQYNADYHGNTGEHFERWSYIEKLLESMWKFDILMLRSMDFEALEDYVLDHWYFFEIE